MRRYHVASVSFLVLLMPALVTAEPIRRHKAHRLGAAAHKAAVIARRGGLDGPYGPTSADPYPPSAEDDPNNPRATPGAALRALARRNQAAPGVTNELAPDNKATATGGPVGGVPGFEGM